MSRNACASLLLKLSFSLDLIQLNAFSIGSLLNSPRQGASSVSSLLANQDTHYWVAPKAPSFEEVISQSFYDQLNFIIKMIASRVYLLTNKQYARRFAFLGLVATCCFTGIQVMKGYVHDREQRFMKEYA